MQLIANLLNAGSSPVTYSKGIMMRKLVKNAAKCVLCEDIIESKYRHDFVSCKCGEIFVDGGLDYQRAGANSFTNFIDLSEYKEVENGLRN